MKGHTRTLWSIVLAAVAAVVALAVLLGVGVTAGVASAAAGGETRPAEAIDWARARELLGKERNGQALTAEERAYLDRAREARARGEGSGAQSDSDLARARELMQKVRNGGTLTAEERAFVERVRQAQAGAGGRRPQAPPPRDRTGLVPLDEMTAKDTYKGEDGGLYGGGKNVPPPAFQEAAAKELAKIAPLDADGKAAADGKIVLISIGMSNTTQEFSKFKELADRDAAKSPAVVIVDCAQGAQDAARWSDASLPAWRLAQERLRAAGVTPRQVQAVWMKHARIGPAQYGEFPKHGQELRGHVLASLHIAKRTFPNLRVAYLSSRIYAGYATTGLNPEPYAYESAFVVRWLIREQIKGDASLNYDPAKGEAKAPFLLWGPYLWADGVTPRKSDQLVWLRDDLGSDGTHPSRTAGREKVAKLLMAFFKTDPNAKGWFCKAAASSGG